MRLSERSPMSVRIVEERAERVGYALRRVGDAWALWAPDPATADPFASRPAFVGPWFRIKQRVYELECERKVRER